jgi:hypothetical protein
MTKLIITLATVVGLFILLAWAVIFLIVTFAGLLVVGKTVVGELRRRKTF